MSYLAAWIKQSYWIVSNDLVVAVISHQLIQRRKLLAVTHNNVLPLRILVDHVVLDARAGNDAAASNVEDFNMVSRGEGVSSFNGNGLFHNLLMRQRVTKTTLGHADQESARIFGPEQILRLLARNDCRQ